MKGLHTEWSDEIVLIKLTGSQDAAGYRNPTETRSDPPLLCSFEDGVSQSEFYRSRKAGMQADAQAQVWTADYEEFFPASYAGRRRCELRDRKFEILRSFPESMDITTLILQEVER